MKPNKSGFMLLETVVCLAILGILFPLTQKYILFVYQTFQETRLKLQAVQIASAEMSRMEAQLESHAAGKNMDTRAQEKFWVESEIKTGEDPLMEISVRVEWQYHEKPQIYVLKQLYIPGGKNEKNIALS